MQDPGALTAATDEILLHRAAQIYPVRPRRDERISQDPQFSMRARELWRLYKDYRAIGKCTQRTVLTKWRLWVQLKKASKQMRDSVKEVKRQKVKAIMLELEQAARKGTRAAHMSLFAGWLPGSRPRNPASAVPQGSFSHLLSNSRHCSRTPKRSSVRAWISYRRELCAKASQSLAPRYNTRFVSCRSGKLRHRMRLHRLSGRTVPRSWLTFSMDRLPACGSRVAQGVRHKSGRMRVWFGCPNPTRTAVFWPISDQ